MKYHDKTRILVGTLKVKDEFGWKSLGESLRVAARQFRYTKGMNSVTGEIENYLDIPIGKYRTMWKEIHSALKIWDEMDRRYYKEEGGKGVT